MTATSHAREKHIHRKEEEEDECVQEEEEEEEEEAPSPRRRRLGRPRRGCREGDDGPKNKYRDTQTRIRPQTFGSQPLLHDQRANVRCRVWPGGPDLKLLDRKDDTHKSI